MYKSKIEWCESTWNPVTGCLNNCKYCYARRLATRFEGYDRLIPKKIPEIKGGVVVLDTPAEKKGKTAPYPLGFRPTFHRYLLDLPQHWRSPRTIFVCSMSDLFGRWVPDALIEEVFAACDKAPQHTYLFLTKNPFRYEQLHLRGILRKRANMWYGYSATHTKHDYWFDSQYNVFASVEPILEPVSLPPAHWLIIGAETGNQKGKITPERGWIENLCDAASTADIPVFMKDSLIPVIGEANMRREFPWKIKM